MINNQEAKYTEEEELAVRQEVEKACMNAIVAYLTEVADTMVANKMIALTVADIRAMSDAMKNRMG